MRRRGETHTPPTYTPCSEPSGMATGWCSLSKQVSQTRTNCPISEEPSDGVSDEARPGMIGSGPASFISCSSASRSLFTRCWECSLQKTSPHRRQWWRRSRKENCFPHPGNEQCVALWSGTQSLRAIILLYTDRPYGECAGAGAPCWRVNGINSKKQQLQQQHINRIKTAQTGGHGECQASYKRNK